MRPQKVADVDLLKGMMSVFQSKGYEGASLNELANSSGLQKASLYHRFPGGKKEIATTVLSYISDAIHENIYEALANKNKTPDQRLDKVLEVIDSLYEGGKKSCILRVLSMDSGLEMFGEEVAHNMKEWMEGFKILGLAFGMDKNQAAKKAEKSLILVQGGLIVSKGIASPVPFQNALESVSRMYRKE